jgi:hypothetical protein
MPQVNIHSVGNHFATFYCALVFLKFLTFLWWLFHKYGISLDDVILDLIIEVMKGGISSELIKFFLIDGILDSDDWLLSGYNHLKSFVCFVWNIENLCDVFC